jgi:hypothetical protein
VVLSAVDGVERVLPKGVLDQVGAEAHLVPTWDRAREQARELRSSGLLLAEMDTLSTELQLPASRNARRTGPQAPRPPGPQAPRPPGPQADGTLHATAIKGWLTLTQCSPSRLGVFANTSRHGRFWNVACCGPCSPVQPLESPAMPFTMRCWTEPRTRIGPL